MSITRRGLIAAAPLGLASVSLAGQTLAPAAAVSGGLADELYPSSDPALTRDIVGASHANLARVREILAERPALANAAWDWGFGDWETALGAASHTGQREIAAVLMEHGARPDIFTFAMLGHVDVVRACVAAQPGIQRLHGPHGITLLRHAQAGGDKAAAVVAYLTSLGDADVGYETAELAPEWAQRYVGSYRFGSRPQDRFKVGTARNGFLTIQREVSGSARNLFHQGEHAFLPAGARQARVVFSVRGTEVTGLTVTDGPARVQAERVAD